MTFDLKAMATCRLEGTEASLVTKLHTKANDTLCVCSIKDGTALLTAHDASLVKIWSTEDGSLVHNVQTPVQGCASCVCASPITEHNFMVSVDDTVLVYDHRDLLTPAHQFNFNQEEVNEIDVHPKGNFLSSCDDGGDIKVIDVGNAKLFKTLSRQHSNICSTVKFHPRKPWELISGGLDCNLVRWDFNRGRALSPISVSDEECSKQFGMYTINPPMVHSIDTLNSSVVCGLGNGSIAVYSLQGKTLIPKCSAALHSASGTPITSLINGRCGLCMYFPTISVWLLVVVMMNLQIAIFKSYLLSVGRFGTLSSKCLACVKDLVKVSDNLYIVFVVVDIYL